MVNLHSWVIEAAGHLGKIFPAYLHQQRVHLYHVDLLNPVVFHQLPHHSAVPAADYQDVLHIGMYSHGYMADHLMVYEFIHLRQHKVAVGHKDFPEFSGIQHINALIFTLGRE